jgi:uncharacterized LabA/DUF88 family protein
VWQALKHFRVVPSEVFVLTVRSPVTTLVATIPPVASAQGARPPKGGLCFSGDLRRTIVYIDAFNLYYGCLKRTPFRWLNLESLARRLLAADNEIRRIKYYTARVGARPTDPDQPTRQQLYLRALGTLSLVEVHYGHYLSHEVTMPLANPTPGGTRYAKVLKTEEKGSDVNLATHLVADAYENAFDVAAIITNDSDLLEPVRLVRQRLKKVVGILNPQPHPAFVLKQTASFFKQIRPAALKASQFPDNLRDTVGDFHKPPAW